MTFITKNAYKSAVTLSVLAVLAGFVSTGCSSESEAVVVKPAAVADSASKTAKDKPSPDANIITDTRKIQPAAAASSKPQPVQPSVPVVSASEAGEDAYAVEDIARQGPLTDADPGYNTMEDIEFADASPAVDERQLVLDTPTDAELTYEGVVLPRIIPGLVVGMPYEQARMLILADGWRPADGLEPASRNGMDDYMEVEACSGSGMGLCNMSFVDAEMNRFGLTTWGSGPTVRDWSDVW